MDIRAILGYFGNLLGSSNKILDQKWFFLDWRLFTYWPIHQKTIAEDYIRAASSKKKHFLSSILVSNP